MIKPKDFEPEEILAIEKLREMGRIVERLPTYILLNKGIQMLLTKTISPTALYIRTLPDLISISETSKISVFLFEVKSWKHQTGNLPIEAIPFGFSRILSEYNINILYLAVKDKNEIRGEFIGKINLPEKIRIPERWIVDERRRLKLYLSKMFPESELIEVPRKGGSGDPYFLIPKVKVDKWSLIENLETIKQMKIS